MRSIFIHLFLLVFGTSLFSQHTIDFQGKVFDQHGNAIDLALVTLVSTSDSTVRYSVFSDRDGSFLVNKIDEGMYKLDIGFPGCDVLFQKIQINKNGGIEDQGNFVLTCTSATLDEVVVKGKTAFIERKTDRIVVNPDVLISNAGSNILETLEKAPGIWLDPSGDISLKGRSGVAVFVDDKPLYLSGIDLQNYLSSIPASSVKHIEIMANPPAKYDAAGNAGVINIVTKRNLVAGFFGNLSLSLQQGRYTRSNNNLNVFYNKNKWSTYLNISGGVRNSFQDLNINRYYKNNLSTNASSFSQNSFIVKKGHSVNIKWGMDYYMSTKMTLGFFVRGLTNPNDNHTVNNALIRDQTDEIRNRVFADNTTHNSFRNVASNLYTKYLTDDEGGHILADVDYVLYRSQSNQIFNNDIFSNTNNPVYSDIILGDLPSDITIVTGRIQYEKFLKDKSKMEIGIKTANTQTDNTAVYSKTIGNITTPDYDLSNQFVYNEWIHAAFVNYNRNIGKWEAQIGFRAETTSFEGFQPGNIRNPDTSFTRIYHNLFPTLFISGALDTANVHMLQFSFGRRIDRPFFQDLNPFVSPLDKYTFYGGNPGLKPTYSNNFSITHSFKNKINTTFSYGFVSDGINETLEIVDSIYYSRPGNISNNHSFSLAVDGGFSLTPRYRINAYGEVGYLSYRSRLYTENLDTSGLYYAMNVTNTLSFNKGWSFELRGEYRSDVVYSQLLIKSFGIVNFGVNKKILKDVGNIRILVSDLFYTRRADGVINNLRNTQADWNSRLDTRSVTVAFSYRFGKAVSQKSKPTGSGSESEQQRVKT